MKEEFTDLFEEMHNLTTSIDEHEIEISKESYRMIRDLLWVQLYKGTPFCTAVVLPSIDPKLTLQVFDKTISPDSYVLNKETYYNVVRCEDWEVKFDLIVTPEMVEYF